MGSEITVPTVIGRYRVLGELARGGMGSVFFAVQSGPGGFEKLVALKVLKEDLARQKQFVDMFMQEARLTAHLSHPGIAQTLEVGEAGGVYFIAMEFVDGFPAQRIHMVAAAKEAAADEGAGELDPRAVELRIWLDVLSALHYAHELTDSDGRRVGVVHRDASPHNVLVTFDGTSRVVDFGVGKALGEGVDTETGVLKGKVRYMAPEQLGGQVDARTDCFTVGVSLWETLAGRRMWDGLNDPAILGKLVARDIPSLRDALPEGSVPSELVAVCQRAVHPDPSQRFRTAQVLHDAIEDVLLLHPRFLASHKHVAQYMDREFGLARRERRSVIDAARNVFRADSKRPEALVPESSSGGTATGVVTVMEELSPRDHQRLRVRLAAAAGVVVAAALALVLFITMRGEKSPAVQAPVAPHSISVSEPSTPSPSSPNPPSPAPQPRQVTLSVETTPVGAVVFLDDAPLGRGPLTKTLAPDSQPHVLRADAAGFISQRQTIRLDGDAHVKLGLSPMGMGIQPRPPPSATATASHTAPPQLSSPIASAPAPTSSRAKPRRDIGREDPYAP